ncbi:hypothetical protein [Hyphomonas sp.]|uniref:hypothetical protein n=1 Tax=Hyphomonas sp. TaxID=87 RepID=UPI00356161BF
MAPYETQQIDTAEAELIKLVVSRAVEPERLHLMPQLPNDATPPVFDLDTDQSDDHFFEDLKVDFDNAIDMPKRWRRMRRTSQLHAS